MLESMTDGFFNKCAILYLLTVSFIEYLIKTANTTNPILILLLSNNSYISLQELNEFLLMTQIINNKNIWRVNVTVGCSKTYTVRVRNTRTPASAGIISPGCQVLLPDRRSPMTRINLYRLEYFINRLSS